MKGIYKITSPSGKVYIGQTRNWERRKKYYKVANCRNQVLLFRSIKKYGWSSHDHEIIHKLPEDVTQSVFDEYERFYIFHYKDQGFVLLNLKEGGHIGMHSPDSILKMSTKRREFHKRNPEISKNMMKPIQQFNKDNVLVKEWKSLKEASEVLGMSYSTVKRSLRKGTKTNNKFTFKYI